MPKVFPTPKRPRLDDRFPFENPQRSHRSAGLDSHQSQRAIAQDSLLLADPSQPDSLLAVATMIKEALRCRYARGEAPSVAEYLKEFPTLAQDHDRVVSLLYEEFCLREEAGQQPDVNDFCQQYSAWQDSLLSQLHCHQVLSQVAHAPSRPVRFPEPGHRFLWFQLDSEIGRGASGRVYLARDETLGNRRLALKLSLDRGNEHAIQARLDHPNIVPVTQVERDPETGLRGLCMPYRAGLPLSEVIRRLHSPSTAVPAIDTRPRQASSLWEVLGAPTEDENDIEASGRPAWDLFPRQGSFADAAAWIALKLAEALAHAHARGVLHRDIKPANILLSRRSGPLLLDFNLSKGPGEEPQSDPSRGGTLLYMAPEQLQAFLLPDNWNSLGPPADIYSLGLVILELLSGCRPSSPPEELSNQRAANDLLIQRLKSRPPSARSLNPDVPHAFQAILNRCLAPNPDDRYQDARALVEDLSCFLQRKPTPHAKNPSLLERTRFRLYRRRVFITISAFVALTGAIAFAITPNEPRAVSTLVSTAHYLILQGDLDRARFELNQLFWSDRNKPEVWRDRILLEFQTNLNADPVRADQYTIQARDELLSHLQDNPEDGIAYSYLGSIYLDMQKDTLALDAFRKSLQYTPNHFLTYLKLGQYYKRKSDRHLWLHYINQAVNVANEQPGIPAIILVNLLIERASANVEPSLAELESLNQTPQEPSPPMALLTNIEQRLDSALEDLKRAEKLGITAYANASANLGHVSPKKENDLRYRFLYANAEAIFGLGEVARYKGEFEPARIHYTDVLTLANKLDMLVPELPWGRKLREDVRKRQDSIPQPSSAE